MPIDPATATDPAPSTDGDSGARLRPEILDSAVSHVVPDAPQDPFDDLPGDPLQLDRQVCFALAVASRSVIALYRPVLEPLGLTHPQYLVMLALWGEQPLSVKGLSRRLALDPGTLSPLVKRLEAAGYVHRARLATDERTLAISLTDAGAALRERALLVPPAIVARLGMPISELEELHRMLTKVIAASLDRVAPDSDLGARLSAGPG